MTPNTQRLLIVIGTTIAVLLLILVLVLLTSGDGDAAADASLETDPTTTTLPASTTSSTTSDSITSTSTAATSSTVATTTTTAAPPSGACSGLPSAVVPGPEPGVSFAAGDFDGDGSQDQLIGYQDAGGTWWVQIALSYGHATETAVPGPVTAVGAASFGAGQDVGYAYVDSGASTQIVGFFYLPGCDVFEATSDSGLARFPIGGGVTHLDGLVCAGDGFTTRSATTADGTNWEYVTTDYSWVPGLGEFQPLASSIALLTSPADDDTIFAAADFGCPNTSL